MRKILHVTTSHKLDDVRIFMKECSTLAEDGYDITLMGFGAINTIYEKNRVKIISFKSIKSNRIFRLLVNPIYVFTKIVGTDFDIIHFHDPEFMLYACILKLFFHKKVIYDIHEDVPKQIMQKDWINGKLKLYISTVYKKFENSISKRCNYLIAATESIKKRFEKENEDTIGVYNYPDLSLLPAISNDYQNRKSICYIGLISRKRGIIELIKAIEICNVNLVLCGEFESDLLKNEVEHLAGWANVTYLGKLPYREAMNTVNSCFAGVVTFLPFPNHLEAMPNKFYEYLAMGVPIIASNFETWKKIIENEKIGICVDPKSPNDIADAISFLKCNSDFVKKCACYGRALVINNYSWSSQYRFLNNAYMNLLA